MTQHICSPKAKETKYVSIFYVHITALPYSLQYIRIVLQDRFHLYNDLGPEILSLGINSIENGIFVNKLLHSLFGDGIIAFLKVHGCRHKLGYLLNPVIFRHPTLH